jgi:hypothetical protein
VNGPVLAPEPDALPVPELVLELEAVVVTELARAVCVIVIVAIEAIRSPDKTTSTPMFVFLMVAYRHGIYYIRSPSDNCITFFTF